MAPRGVWQDGTETVQLTLRQPQSLVFVGQQQPVSQATDVQTVPQPNSKRFKELLHRRISHQVQQRIFAPSLALHGGGFHSVSISRVMGGWPRSLRPKVLEYVSTALS